MSEGNSRESLTSQQRNLLLAEPIARLSLDRRVIFKDAPTIADRLDVQYLALSAIDFVMERSAIESGASPAEIVEHVAAEATRVKPSLTDEQSRKVGQVVLDHLANARDGHKAFRVEYYDADRGGYSFHDFRLLALSVASDGSAKFKLARGAQILTLAMLDVAPEFAQEADEFDARLCRLRARECDEQAHACADRARRAGEHHTQWESRVGDWQLERLRQEQAAQDAEARARDWQTKRDALEDKARTREREAADVANRAAEMEREAGDIEYTAPGGQISENLDVLRRAYKQHLETLKNLEQERIDHLRGQQQEVQRALDRKEDRFGQEFGQLDRAEVEAEAERDGVREATASADADLETARTNASIARADAEGAEREFRSERVRRAGEIKPESLADLRAHEPEDLAGIAAQAEETIIRQHALGAREAEAAARTRQEAARNARTAKEYMSWGTTLDGVLHGESASPERIELPRHEEVAALVNETVSGLVRARAALSEANKRVYESYDSIRKFMNSPTFSRLEGEREVAVHLSESDPLAAAVYAPGTAGLIDDRLKSIEHDLLRLDDDLQACIEELDHLLRTALHIVRRMVRDGRIPDHVPRFGGQPVFRISADLSRIAATHRREILRSYITDLVEDDRVPARGQDIAAEMVERMTAVLGRSTLDIRLLKPKGEGDTEHMPIERVTVSGGELLTAAMMIYLVIARLRADAMHGGTGEAGVLILDNPLGKANKALLLKTQIGLADAMGIQLFYATGVQDTSALAAFENIVRLRRNRQSRATRRIHVEMEAMHAHIDRDTDSDASAAAPAELAAD